MSLFQNSVLRLALAQLNQDDIDTAFKQYKTSFLPKIENIKKSKEEQYQYGFFQDLFVDVFSYVLNPSPDFNLTTEFKNLSDSKKVDGAILVNGEVIAVIELKSTKTKSMQSIVNQAFNYKNNHPTCKYVITSNFEKLRFYVEHSNEFEEFNLFTLSSEQFKLLYLLLNPKDMFSFKALELKKASKLKDEQISNELYKKYSLLRLNLFHNLKKNNNNDPLELLNFTQKILDRMIFIFFGEDRGILKPNTIQAIINHHENDIEDRRLYHFYKIYFEGINKGNKKLDIPEYNGGLFACDEVLDALLIDDEVLNELPLQLSAYDFNSDIDVDILGHIFENSLSDLEEIKANIEDNDFDKSKTKRKKDGVFYTPEYITKYIVENTLGKLCKEKREALGLENIDVPIPKNPKKLNKSEQKIKDALEAYREYILGLKIVDPACGSGAFLNQALNFLIYEHECIDENEKILMGGNVLGLYDVKKEILENNLFGVDINEESVEIAKLSLWLRTVERGRKLNKLANNIKVGNSLIDDKSVVDNAFVWEDEFPEVFAKGGFDVVIGNPPYVQLQSMGKMSNILQTQNYYTFEKTGDIYVLFYELGIHLLRKNGLLGFITSNKWMRTKYGKKLRNFLSEYSNPKQILDLGSGIFESATVDSNILITQNSEDKKGSFFGYDLSKEKEFLGFESYLNKRVYIEKFSDEIWIISNPVEQAIKTKIENIESFLKDFNINIYRGIQTGNNDVFIINKDTRDSLVEADVKSLDLIKPILQGKDIKRYGTEFNEQYLIYTNDEINIENYKAIYNYLFSKKSTLDLKKEVQEKKMLWYSLYRPAKSHIHEFSNEKIIFSKASKEQAFCYDDKDKFITLNTSYIATGENLKPVLSILNSKLAKYIFLNFLQSGGIQGEITVQAIEKLPIPRVLKQDETTLISYTENMLYLNKTFQTKKEKFLNRLKTNLELEKLSKKLEAFYEYDFKELLKELKKKKVILSLKEQDEWEEYFNDYQKELLEIKSKIDKTDKEIDILVYELYGLSDDEIKIVEGI